jgi:hypothetical protein
VTPPKTTVAITAAAKAFGHPRFDLVSMFKAMLTSCQSSGCHKPRVTI